MNDKQPIYQNEHPEMKLASCPDIISGQEAPMHTLLTRHAVQILLAAGHSYAEIQDLTGVAERSARRISGEDAVEHLEDALQRKSRGIGRPSKTEPFRSMVTEILTEQPELLAVEVMRRIRERGYTGSKSALYALVSTVRPKRISVQMRFEGLPGEFSQHDFGQVEVRFADGNTRIVHFFASRLKWSRWAEVSLVEDEKVETLVRTLLDHFVDFGGVPLCAVFDRPKTVALRWRKDGTVTEWNPIFAYAALEVGFTAEVCWPHSPRQKGSVENLVGWVKGSFFKQRRFHDQQDLQRQLTEWLQEINHSRANRATGVVPLERRREELPRLRSPRIGPQELALRIPTYVGPTGEVLHDTHPYSMPPEAAGMPATLYLYRDRVRIIAGRFDVSHPRCFQRQEGSRLPEHRALQLASLSGVRGKRYLKRQHLFETGEAAVRFLTEVVHRDPRGWIVAVDRLHELLQRHGADAINRAFRAAVDVGIFEVASVERSLTGIGLAADASLRQEATV
jgi:transposase